MPLFQIESTNTTTAFRALFVLQKNKVIRENIVHDEKQKKQPIFFRLEQARSKFLCFCF